MASTDLTDDEIDALLKGEKSDNKSGTSNLPKNNANAGQVNSNKKKIKKVAFADLDDSSEISEDGSNLNLLMDVPLDVSVEIGRTKKSVQEVLSLNIGSVIELNKLSGEPVDLLVNGKIIAKAEVVIIDEYFGIRITEIIRPKNRVSFN